jgi:ribose transport system substrate-binding protein
MKFKKSWQVGIVATAVGIALAGCSSNAPTTGTSKPISVGFVVGLTSDPYFITMHTAAAKEAKKLGVKLIWSGSTTTYSPSAEIPYVNAVLAQNPSVFVLGSTDANALVPSVKKAIGLHIPVLTADSSTSDTSDLKSQIAGNNVDGGSRAADLLAKSIGESGDVLLFQGVPGITPTENRAKGFTDELKKYPNVHIVAQQYSKDQPSTAASLVNQELSRFPNLKGVFAIDDTTAEGVISGLKNSGKLGQVKVVAYDAEPTEITALEAGQLVGLVAQQPGKEGELAVEYAVDIVKGHTSLIKKDVSLPNITITNADYKKYEQYFYQAG